MALTQGWNDEQVTQLVSQIDGAFEELATHTNILTDLETTVQETWKGPDAQHYLDKLFEYFNDQLVPKVNEAHEGMVEVIYDMADKWEEFQQSGASGS